LFESAGKLGATHDEVAAMLRRCGLERESALVPS
jgi:hypothetical protein